MSLKKKSWRKQKEKNNTNIGQWRKMASWLVPAPNWLPCATKMTTTKCRQQRQAAASWRSLTPAGCLVLCALCALWLVARLVPVDACEPIHFGAPNKIACKCDANYCDDSLQFEWPRDSSTLVKLVSNEQGARFQLGTENIDKLISDNNKRDNVSDVADFLISINLNRRHQQVIGYGGAITDSAAMLLGSALSSTKLRRPNNESLADVALRSYFGANGLDYNMARVPIGGTDMSWRPYSCADMNKEQLVRGAHDDFELSNFRLQSEDTEHKLPLIERALEIRRNVTTDHYGRRDEEHLRLRIIMTSWSAPNWMKSQHDLVQGHLRGSTGGAYYDAYARYSIKFIDEYERILAKRAPPFKVWAMTPQNEPRSPSRLGPRIVNYNSVNFSPEQMHEYISENLVPELVRANRSSDEFALFVWDDTLLGLPDYQRWLEFRHEPKVREYIRGLAVHWYSQGLDKVPYSALYDLRRTLPYDYALLSTEASFIGQPQPGDWSRGERYARDIIANLRAGSLAWLDWNLALNMAGGPTWSRNFLDAAILVDEHGGIFYKNPMFYAIGHFSRFVRARSHILESHLHEQSSDRTFSGWKFVSVEREQSSDILAVASELDPSDKHASPEWRRIAIVLLNRANAGRRVALKLGANCRSLDAAQVLVLELSARSITSLALSC